MEILVCKKEVRSDDSKGVVITVVDSGDVCDFFDEKVYRVYTNQVNRGLFYKFDHVGDFYIDELADRAISTSYKTIMTSEEIERFL